MSIPRSQWARALSALPEKVIVSLAADFQAGHELVHKAVPQEGLGLLRMVDGAKHDHFYLGEIPVTCAHIELRGPKGGSFSGAAQVMNVTPDHAVALAVCDAAIAHRLPGWETVYDLVESGMEIIRRQEQVRSAMVQKTRVSFSQLEQMENVDEDSADLASADPAENIPGPVQGNEPPGDHM